VFHHEGPARSPRKNALLAGSLAFVAGFVNSGGFLLIGTFTSHVTGSVGRLSTDVANWHPSAAFFALLMILSFFGGAFLASLLVETSAFERSSRAYAAALGVEALLLFAFILVAAPRYATHPRALDAQAAILCIAMGMQNSLVTRLSGAVVRTTHLTGVVTDLAIEAARWYRWHRAKLRQIPELLPSRSPPRRPAVEQAFLLLTIAGSFMAGALLGALFTMHWSRWSMLAPAAAVVLLGLYAFVEPTEQEVGSAARVNDA
jgi:uncharacterized membrane protein YoaK (UPF0700 family)